MQGIPRPQPFCLRKSLDGKFFSAGFLPAEAKKVRGDLGSRVNQLVHGSRERIKRSLGPQLLREFSVNAFAALRGKGLLGL